MDLLILILAILALAGVVLHTLLWATVPSYRRPLLFHLSCIAGFTALLLLVMGK